jgi:very-short-patch-repair endonuclease
MRIRARQLCGAKFRRQHPIGRYIVDFFCLERGLVVELDGSQHANQTEADQQRSDFLNRCGYLVLRFWDNEVFEDIDAVLEKIVQVLCETRPSPIPSPTGRGLRRGL